MSGGWLPTEEAMPRARAAAMKALELDPNLAAAHSSLGYVAMTHDWRWDEAARSYRRALELNPGDVMTHQNYGTLLLALGQFGESEQEIARAREIDPLSPLLASMSLWPLFEGHQFDRTIAAAEKFVQVDPSVANARMILGQALLFKGQYGRAIAEIQKAIQLDSTSSFPVGWLGYAYGVSGQRAKALETMSRLQEMQERVFVQPYSFALVLTSLGEKDKALDWLEKAAGVRSDELIFFKVDPAMDPLRSEPRFQAILKRMGFPA